MTVQNKTIFFLVFLTIVSIRLFGMDAIPMDGHEFTKEIEREFNTSSEGTVEILNKYGTVDIKTWSQNRVKVEVSIIVDAPNEKEANGVFDRISINFSSKKAYVSAKTSITPQKNTSSWWQWTTNPSYDFQIHYVVHMPQSNSLKLRTKYCDATLDYLSANGQIEMKYGDFESAGFGGDVDIILSYGKGRINHLQNIEGELNYGGLTLKRINNMTLESKYSQVKITKARDLDINSKYDTYRVGDISKAEIDTKYSDYYIDQVDDTYFDGKYSNLKIDYLINSADIHSRYGKITIVTLENGFGLVNLKGSYTDFKVGTEGVQAFCFEVDLKNGEISTPVGANIRATINEGNQKRSVGFVHKEYCSSKIRGVIQYGSFIIN